MSPRQLLTEENGEPRRLSLAILVLLFAGAVWTESCTMLHRRYSGEDMLRFSHASHAKHVKDCNTCHVNKEDETVARAGHAACVACHPSAVSDKPADKSCLLCHHSLSTKTVLKAERPNYERANFTHESHKDTSCADCHGNVNNVGRRGHINFPRMEECLACHFPAINEPSQAECFVCHFDLTAKDMPENHKTPDWKSFAHGPVSQSDEALCARCHIKENDCATCHAVERPPSHTAVFRAKTHGFQAMSNPNKCEICHTQDFCEACHRTTEPISHTAAFMGKPYLHCATCHLPLEDGNRCAVCHQGDPHEHVIADPPPPDLVEFGLINPREPCLPCHPVNLVPIPHPYNSISALECVTCHRPL